MINRSFFVRAITLPVCVVLFAFVIIGGGADKAIRFLTYTLSGVDDETPN